MRAELGLTPGQLGIVLLAIAVGLFALGVALWSTAGGRALLQLVGARFDDLWSAIQGVFG